MFGEVLEQDPAGPVDDALRSTGGSRRVENVQRVVEGQSHELGPVRRVVGQEVGQGGRPVRERASCLQLIGVGNYNNPREGGHPVGEVGQPGGDVVIPAGVVVSVGCEQHHRFDLAEPVQHSINPEVGGGGGEHGAQRRGGQHHRVGLGNVGEPSCHPVARSNPGFPQCAL